MSTFTILLVLITIVSILLVAVIMIQKPKGGGLDSSFGGGGSVGGVQNTNKFLDKSTWTLGAILIVLILLSGISFNAGLGNESKVFDENAASSTPTESSLLPNADQQQQTTDTPTESETQE